MEQERRNLLVAVSKALMKQYVSSNRTDKEVYELWNDFVVLCCELEKESTQTFETKALDLAVRHILDDIQAIEMDLACVEASEAIITDMMKKLDCMRKDLTDNIYWAADIDYRG